MAAAKINVGLHVGRLRSDGFHDVCGLVHTVSLIDRLEITVGQSERGVLVDPALDLRVAVPRAPELETPDNLVVRVARELAKRRSPPPTSIEVTKSIPIAAGLGGGSADAAAAIAALGVAWGLRLGPTDGIEIAARVSSDAPAIFAGGLVHVSGRGERVRRVGKASSGAFVLGISAERISAAEAYAAFDLLGDPAPAHAIEHNDLESAARTLVPALNDRVDALRDAGAHPVFVSGSGPTIVGVAESPSAADAIAARAAPAFERVEVVRPLSWGVRVEIGAQSPPLD
jgi:4-diphosphocytidyl-2-C-methyl-D-erythritol kinase